jgi:hypothetical protein
MILIVNLFLNETLYFSFLQAGNFYSTVGAEGFMLTTLCAGMTPVSSLFELVTQV